MATIDTKEVLTSSEVASMLDVATDTITKYCQRGVLKAQKAGRDWLIPKSEVKRYQRDRKPAGRPAKSDG